MPLQRRVPKRGFKNVFSKNIARVNLRDLNRFEDGTEITPEVLQSAGLVRKNVDGVKILGGLIHDHWPGRSDSPERSSADAVPIL